MTICVTRSHFARAAALVARAMRLWSSSMPRAASPTRPASRARLLGHAAELGLVNHVLQVDGTVGQRPLEVLREEELRVGEPGGEHPLVAPRMISSCSGSPLWTARKLGRRLPAPSSTGKYLW